ncbi:MAG: SNF2 helicase associated domain-containing protein [Eubacteriales bacterium]
MITIADIKDEANTKTYIRGMQLYKTENVLYLEYEDYKEDGYQQREIKASVQGSGYNQYQVSVIVDEEYHTIVESNCNCRAFSSYSGICKHCVAVLLTYINMRDKQKKKTGIEALENHKYIQKGVSHLSLWENSDLHIQGSEMSRYEVENKLLTSAPIISSLQAGEATGFKNEIQIQHRNTSLDLKRLLEKSVLENTLPYLQNEYIGKVAFIPYLEKRGDNFQIEFKIGISHMYVLKDLVKFYQAFESKEAYRYGQKLHFIHHIKMFQEESKDLVQFVLKQLEKLKREQPYHFSVYSKSNMRELYLDSGELEEFLLLMENQEFHANIDDKGERLWQIAEKDIQRKLLLIEEAMGVTVEVKNSAMGYRCDRYYFYFQDGTIYKIAKDKLDEIAPFLECIGKKIEKSLYIDKGDMPLFIRELLPTLKLYYEIENTSFLEEAYSMKPVKFAIYLDAPEPDFITCEVKSIYGEKMYNVYQREEEIELRDIPREVMVGQAIGAFCNAFDESKQCMVIAQDEDKIYHLLMEGIPRLQEMGEVYISDTLKGVKVTVASQMSVGVSLSGDMLELNLTAGDMELEQLMEIMSKYDRRKKYYRLKNGDFLNVQGEGLETLIELQKGLQIDTKDWQNGRIVLPKFRALYLDAQLKEKNNLSYSKNKNFKALIRNMKTIDDNDYEIPASLEDILREYQKTGFLWIKTLKSNGFGGILADDMGLGKTLQIIAVLLSEYLEAKQDENKRCLIVTPASLVFNWSMECKRFAPMLPVKMVVGTMGERSEIIKNSTSRDILITSYDLLKRDLESYQDIAFHCQIIDEAQYIKNHNTRAAKAVKKIESSFRLALTGTPMENRLSELWSIFDYLMPGFLKKYQNFREQLEIPITQNQDEAALRRLQKMIHPFILRRLKEEVLTDLPDKLEENLYVQLNGEQQKIYDAHVKRMQLMLDKKTDKEWRESKIQILAELTKLRQICCNPSLIFDNYKGSSAKIDMCMELLQRAANSGHKVLLFSQFTTMLEQLQERMIDEKISFFTLTGATKKEKRMELVEQFNKDQTSVFCISLKAGGTGLNLTSADIVIHFDPWWNVAVQNQATDRAHRIGQKNVVNVYKLIAQGTIEENIVKLQQKKTHLAEQVLEGEMVLGSSFTKEELLELLT